MINRIRKNYFFKKLCIFLAFNLIFEIIFPLRVLALTGGPSQPEFNSFTPIGISDMVDLSSGDVNYNIPLLDVGGYPINISYGSGVSMDEEASWVGLGWNLSIGQINHNVRGIPDEFNGDEIEYKDNMKPNVTVGGTFKMTPFIFGKKIKINPKITEYCNKFSGMVASKLDITEDPDQPAVKSEGDKEDKPKDENNTSINLGLSMMYNNYSGFDIRPSVGMSIELTKNCSVGFGVESGNDGLSISPNFNFNMKGKDKLERELNLGLGIGVAYNSRQGLSNLSMDGFSRTTKKANKKNKNAALLNSSSTKTIASGGSIDFNDISMSPTVRNGIFTYSFRINAALGSEVTGAEGQMQIEAYGTVQKLKQTKRVCKSYGYSNTQYADQTSVVDVSREKDGALSTKTSNLAVTNYSYDIHSIQGQGISGNYRPYRNSVGYVFDTYSSDGSSSSNIGIELGIGNVAHSGVDFGNITVKSHSGLWESKILKYFKNKNPHNISYEEVNYKNVGDLSVDQNFSEDEESQSEYQIFNRTGKYEAVHIPIVGIKFLRFLKNQYTHKKRRTFFDKENIDIKSPINRNKRRLRNQVISNISILELKSGVGFGPLKSNQNITYPNHHVGEIQILRNDGSRYVYGQPLYNNVKKEVTFSVDQSYSTPVDRTRGLVNYSLISSDLSSENFDNLPNDRYYNSVKTPAYAHSHLLTSILSQDYEDIEIGNGNDGPSLNDLGSYTKFTYQTMNNSDYKWRIPYEANYGSYNEGLKTEPSDDQASYIYGEKEIKYIKTVETKTHIAVFTLTPRKDALGVLGEHGGMDKNQKSYKLSKISLYARPDYELNQSKATPVKEVNFEYTYDLCPGVPNNDLSNQNLEIDEQKSVIDNSKNNFGGKLTLKKIYFTYQNSKMGKYFSYKFDYNENILNQNPIYNLKGYDIWGNYKPNTTSGENSAPIGTMEFPYVDQDDKNVQDQRSAVWLLKKVDLPSGGNIKINYESDDYQYVQNKRAMKMFKVAGMGNSNNSLSSNIDQKWDKLNDEDLIFKRRFIYVKVPENQEYGKDDYKYIKSKYFSNFYRDLLQFRFFVNMTPKGGFAKSESELNESKFDYVSGYTELDLPHSKWGVLNPSESDYPKIFASNGGYYLSIPVKFVNKEGGLMPDFSKRNPISKAAWNFGRKHLSRHVFGNNLNAEGNATSTKENIKNVLESLFGVTTLVNLLETLHGPNGILEAKHIGLRYIKDHSFVRLSNPTGSKLGGGYRVKSVYNSDVWDEMTSTSGGVSRGYKTVDYGQVYNYSLIDGSSSGVATFEPYGAKDNPFVRPVFVTTRHLLAPNDVNYTEEPFGETFFPSPQVTYSRVIVNNIIPDSKINRLNRTGYIEHLFYTSKDYPTVIDRTRIQLKYDKKGVLGNLLKAYSKRQMIASQGYVIHVNDMNGKPRAQRVYAEGKLSAISGVDYLYDHYSNDNSKPSIDQIPTNQGKLNNKVNVIYQDGSIKQNTIGVESDIINDFRESHTVTHASGISPNLAAFVIAPFPGLIPLLNPRYSRTDEKVNTVVTTKVINTFGILRETIAYEDGSSVSTRNLAWDALTGEVLLTQTTDEYSDKIYTLNYPAHWFYPGMGLASSNIGISTSLEPDSSTSGNYKLSNNDKASDFLIDGDEIMYKFNNVYHEGWVVDVNEDKFKLIDRQGDYIELLTKTDFKIFRSGKRNLQIAGIMNVTLMHNPLMTIPDANGISVPISKLDNTFLKTVNDLDWKLYRIITAGAVEYSDNWPVDCECFSSITNNPYLKNAKGVWRTKMSHTFLTSRNYLNAKTPRREGFFMKFSPFYQFGLSGFGIERSNWQHVSEITKYSPNGPELENKDALNRYSGAVYGYNNKFPIAVGANGKYSELAFDCFEDYDYTNCDVNSHFKFKPNFGQNGNLEKSSNSSINAHTGKYSVRVKAGKTVKMNKKLMCPVSTY